MGIGINTHIGIGNIVGKGALLNQIPFKSDLAFHTKTRSGLTLVDEISGNNASILPANIKLSFKANGAFANSGVLAQENTIWVFKARNWQLKNSGYNIGSPNLCIGTGSTNKWYYRWGSAVGYSSAGCDFLWHVFILYNKKLWILDVATVTSDTNILNIINTITPTISLTATWVTQTTNIIYGKTVVTNTFETLPWEYSESYIGSITAGVIAWSRKHIFNNINCVYDLLSEANNIWWQYGNNLIGPDSTSNAISHSDGGSQHCLNYGYSVYKNYGSPDIQVPYLLFGIPQTSPIIPSGYVWYQNIPGTLLKHNLAKSMVEFVDSVFDRSNVTIYTDLARAATTYYDAANPKRWHISEFNRLLLNDWINADYKGRWFPKELPNSVDNEAKNLLDELIVYATNKTGNDFSTVLKYTKDYNLIVI